MRATTRYEPGVAYLSGGLGDHLTQLPHLAAIAAASDGNTVALGSIRADKAAALFGHLPYIGPVIDMWEARHLLRARTFRAIPRIGRLERPAAWFLHRSTTMLLLSTLAGQKRRIGFHRGESIRRALLTDAVDLRAEAIPDLWGRGVTPGPAKVMLERLGFTIDYDAFRFEPDQGAIQAMRARYADRPLPWLVLGIGGSWPEKRWPIDAYIEVVKRLSAQRPMTFLLFGGEDSLNDGARLRSNAPSNASFIDMPAAGLGLGAEHALVALSAGYLGNDSFGLNLTAYCGLPAIGLFGDTPPLAYRRNIHAVSPDSGTGMAGISAAAAVQAAQYWIPALR